MVSRLNRTMGGERWESKRGAAEKGPESRDQDLLS